MTFYEQELRKIIGEQYPNATYVGRACYVRLNDMNRAKIQFVTGMIASQYNALQLTILNRSEGQVDTLRLRFSDLLGTKMTSHPNFRNGVEPHIWDDYGKADWYVYHPTRQDYEKLSNAVSDYLEVFQDMSQSTEEEYRVEEQVTRRVYYADQNALTRAIVRKYPPKLTEQKTTRSVKGKGQLHDAPVQEMVVAEDIDYDRMPHKRTHYNLPRQEVDR